MQVQVSTALTAPWKQLSIVTTAPPVAFLWFWSGRMLRGHCQCVVSFGGDGDKRVHCAAG